MLPDDTLALFVMLPLVVAGVAAALTWRATRRPMPIERVEPPKPAPAPPVAHPAWRDTQPGRDAETHL